MKFSDVIARLDGVSASSLSLSPEHDPDIHQPAAIEEAIAGDLSYVEGRKFAAKIATTAATALILPKTEALQQQAAERGLAWVSVADPRLAFAQVIALFYQPFQLSPGIHPSAVIHDSVQLGHEVAIGAHVVIQADVVIGNGVCIHPGVVVYPGSSIGDRTVLHANCVIHERTQIGQECVIHGGAVIGSEGFGFVPTAAGWLKMEQSGQTVLEDGVEIGCNSAVDRPAVGETRIGKQTKVDNMVQIGHGVTIGHGCAVAAQVGLAGGVTVGDRVILAGQVGVANQVTIGSGVTATAKSGIMTDIEPGMTVSGRPTVPHRMWLKTVAAQRRLPEMQRQLVDLQAQMRTLQQQMAAMTDAPSE